MRINEDLKLEGGVFYIVFYASKTYGPQFVEAFSTKKKAQAFCQDTNRPHSYEIAKRFMR